MWWQMKSKTCRVTSNFSQNVIHPPVIISQPFWGEVVGMVVQTAARNKNWRLLMHCLLICSCTIYTTSAQAHSAHPAHVHSAHLPMHSLLILLMYNLHNVCSCTVYSSAHALCAHLHSAQSAHPMYSTLHCSAQPLLIMLRILFCSSYTHSAERWSCTNNLWSCMYPALLILPRFCWKLVMQQNCSSLRNFCSSYFKVCYDHPTAALLNTDHAILHQSFSPLMILAPSIALRYKTFSRLTTVLLNANHVTKYLFWMLLFSSTQSCSPKPNLCSSCVCSQVQRCYAARCAQNLLRS